MSTSFLTIAQANAKLGSSISGTSTSFVTKAQLVASGKVDTSKLTGYSDNQYPIDDNILVGSTDVRILLTNSNGTTMRLVIHRESAAPVTYTIGNAVATTISIPNDITDIIVSATISTYNNHLTVNFLDSSGLTMSNLTQLYCTTTLSTPIAARTQLTRNDGTTGWYYMCTVSFTNSGKSFSFRLTGDYL